MANIIYKINQGGTDYNIASSAYCTCGTAAGTKAKVANLQNSSSNGFILATGVTIHVKFTYSNTVADPTLNVNETGAKSIMRYGTTAASTSTKTSWRAGAVVSFTYDGTNWVMNTGIDDDTVYSLPTASSTTKGGVKIGDNITISSGTISLTKSNVTSALGFEPVGTGAAVGNTAKPIYWAEDTGPALCTGISAELNIPEFEVCVGDVAQNALSTTSISSSTGTSEITLSHGGKYVLSACGDNFIFTMPSQYSLPLASSSTRGGIKIGYSASAANIPLKLSSEKGYVTLTGTAIKSAVDNAGDLSWAASSYTFKDGTSGESLRLDGSLMYRNSSNVSKMIVTNTGNMGIAGYLYQMDNTSKRAPWSTTIYNIEKVSNLPSSPSSTTLYIVI